jgi:hypothetical protein
MLTHLWNTAADVYNKINRSSSDLLFDLSNGAEVGGRGFGFGGTLSGKHLSYTSGFWPRVRARALRAPVFLSSLTHKTGRCAPLPPIAATLLLIYPPKLSLRTELGPPGARISFH